MHPLSTFAAVVFAQPPSEMHRNALEMVRAHTHPQMALVLLIPLLIFPNQHDHGVFHTLMYQQF